MNDQPQVEGRLIYRQVCTFGGLDQFSYPPDIRKAIYTTNSNESRNSVILAVSKKCKVFPTDDSVRKVIYLGSKNASKKCSMPIQNWRLAMSHFIIEFGDRLSDHL